MRTTIVLVPFALCGLLACQPASQQKGTPAPVERGKYLVSAMSCNDCHTPLKLGEKGPEPDMTRMLSGHPEQVQISRIPRIPLAPWGWVGSLTNTAFAGPWGVSFATNLTPDEETGIGALSDSDFILAMRKGQHLGAGQPILPPMPWSGIGALTDDDLKAMFAYLKSVPPIKNHVPSPLPPVPAH
jgi:hypothetical protein